MHRIFVTLFAFGPDVFSVKRFTVGSPPWVSVIRCRLRPAENLAAFRNMQARRTALVWRGLAGPLLKPCIDLVAIAMNSCT